MKEWTKHPEKFRERPRIPRYKRRDGEFILVFTNQQAKLREGGLILPKLIGLKIKTRIKEGLREVRVIPRGVGYVLEIVYNKTVEVIKRNKDRIVGIDLGVRNLITMVNNIGEAPIVVRGGCAVHKPILQQEESEIAEHLCEARDKDEQEDEEAVGEEGKEAEGFLPQSKQVRGGVVCDLGTTSEGWRAGITRNGSKR